jgi:uncharacterized protein (TIGR00299 family) protein
MRIIHFDAFCGASGDMIVGALIDAGAPFEAIKDALNSLQVHGLGVSAEKINKHGVTATQFHVHEDHHHHHPHRNLDDCLDIIAKGDFPQEVKDAAGETFRRIAVAEAEVHGTTVDAIHFHEVGAIDSIADIVAANLALHLLHVERVTVSPLHVGAGTVKIAHGVLPVPAPATALLLKDAPTYATDVLGELVTPTGAALLTQWAAEFRQMPRMRVQAVGYGSGTRDLPDRPNVLRVFLGEAAAQLAAGEVVTIIEADIDDMNPELFPPLIAQLLAKGARDAFLTPLIGKKGRPAYLLTVLCDQQRVGDLVPAIFAGSTTFGVRMRTEERFCLDREWKKASTEWGDVRVKIGKYAGETVSMSPEFEDCRAAAEKHNVAVRAVYQAAQAAAVKGELKDV